jgi:spore germination protein YaaH
MWSTRNRLPRLPAVLATLFAITCGCLSRSGTQPEKPPAAGLSTRFIVLASQHRAAGTAIPDELKTNARAVDIVAPMWFDATDVGEVAPAANCSGPYTAYAEFCRQHKIRLMPIVRNFSPKALLSDPQAIKACAENTAALARREEFDGIVMDIEQMQPELQPALVSLMQELYPLLQKDRRRLCIAVNARDWGKWDYRSLAQYSDWLYVMFYDYTGSWNKSVIGPTAPLDWPERSADIRRDLQRILATGTPPAKLLFGIPLYGNDYKLDPAGGASAVTIDYLDPLLGIQRRHNAPRLWDEVKQCPYFEYQDAEGVSHRVWYEDAESFRAKIQLARESKLGGVAFWSLRGTPANVNLDFWATVRETIPAD